MTVIHKGAGKPVAFEGGVCSIELNPSFVNHHVRVFGPTGTVTVKFRDASDGMTAREFTDSDDGEIDENGEGLYLMPGCNQVVLTCTDAPDTFCRVLSY